MILLLSSLYYFPT